MKSHASRSDVSLNLFQTVGLWGSAFGAVWGRGAGEGLAEAQRGFPLSVEWSGRTTLMERTPPAVLFPDCRFEGMVNLGQDVKEALNWV